MSIFDDEALPLLSPTLPLSVWCRDTGCWPPVRGSYAWSLRILRGGSRAEQRSSHHGRCSLAAQEPVQVPQTPLSLGPRRIHEVRTFALSSETHSRVPPYPLSTRLNVSSRQSGRRHLLLMILILSLTSSLTSPPLFSIRQDRKRGAICTEPSGLGPPFRAYHAAARPLRVEGLRVGQRKM
jgi:hypothetical protein